MSDFKKSFEDQIQFFNTFAAEYFANNFDQSLKTTKLFESVLYSFDSGGKRFRPLLCYSFAEAFGVGPKAISFLALAIEMIHTYSLIHDDLPCMDNDNFRRGIPTNHKKYDEATALLAGDALLTESFRCLSRGYTDRPDLAIKLVHLLSDYSGFEGMILGQVLDIQEANSSTISYDQLVNIHKLKTGKLMSLCLEATAYSIGLDLQKCNIAKILGEDIGIFFQLADDIDDIEQGKDELSAVRLVGLEGTIKKIDEKLNQIQKAIRLLSIPESSRFYQIIELIKPASPANNKEPKI
jgi:geranylgeranyl diphosphate synthase type II